MAHWIETIAPLPLSNPLAAEWFLVQHFGIQQWLSRQLTHHTGMLTNARFLFPNQLVDLAFKAFLPDHPGSWDLEDLRWMLFERLLDNTIIPEIGDFGDEEGEPDELRRYQLAVRLANLFD